MYKTIFNKRRALKFKHFSRKGYSLFAVLGREVLVGTLSVSTLTYAKAEGISTDVDKVTADTTIFGHEQQLDEVGVTASRAPLNESQQARMVTVLTREDIAQAPVQSINDLMKYTVGVDVRQRGPIGSQTDISVRGGNYEQVTILLNGVNINDPQTGHNAFDFPCDISDIERIEVLEGPAARVYGTSSLLGAINIVTKTPQKTSVQAHIEGGSYGYVNTGARLSYANMHWSHSVSGNYTRSDGYSRNKAGGLNADYKGGKVYYQGRYADDANIVKWYAGLSTRSWGSNTFYGAKWDDQFEHTFKVYTNIQSENTIGKVHLKPSIYWNRNMDRFELFRDNSSAYPFNYHRTDVYGVNLNAWFDWSLGRTAFGGELRNEDLVSGNLGEPLDNPKHIHGTDRNYEYGINRTNIQFFIEHNILLKNFTLSAGFIAVKNTQADMNMRVYPGIDMSYRFAYGWKFYASYNTSLRMPSVTELYYSVGGHKADKHLKPEELAAIEGGFKYNRGGISGKASIYYNHYKNLIDWIRDTSFGDEAVWKSVNFGHINALGIETALDFDFQQLLPSQHFLKKFGIAYAWINQDKGEEGTTQSQFALEYLCNKFTANLQMNIWNSLNMGLNYRLQKRTGSYTDVNGNVGRYATYGILDARLSWDKPNYSIYAEGNNILDKEYHDFGAIPQPGFWLIAGASINFNL